MTYFLVLASQALLQKENEVSNSIQVVFYTACYHFPNENSTQDSAGMVTFVFRKEKPYDLPKRLLFWNIEDI